MRIKTHILYMITGMVLGVVLLGGLVAVSSDRLESAGYPTDLVFFLAINVGWIVPRLLFAFVFRATCPKCGSHAIHKTAGHSRPIYYHCERCGYREKTLWTQGRDMPS